jgi:hypothetical protein
VTIGILLLTLSLAGSAALPKGAQTPTLDGRVGVDSERGEVRFSVRVQYPRGKPGSDAQGQCIQAFLGSERAGGGQAEFADDFVFRAAVDTDEVDRGLAEAGASTKVHYSRAEGPMRAGRDFLQGDPVALFIAWEDGGRRVERRYEEFVVERAVVDSKEVVKPWTPYFVFHGSEAIHKEGTGCIACPGDCPGGIIADNRTPIYEPKPTMRFDLKKASRRAAGWSGGSGGSKATGGGLKG